jgi:hypothetical protein
LTNQVDVHIFIGLNLPVRPEGQWENLFLSKEEKIA